MNDKLRISAAAQLVQVHADTLAVRIHSEGNDAVEQPEEQIDQGEEDAEESGHAHQLGDELAGLRGEESGGQKSPEAGGGVNGDRARGVVDGYGEFQAARPAAGWRRRRRGR